ncbi:WG repeat-containing protein [Fluviicola sp.]|uniref:WG repeat-containing protein n=1 Tax=Fluviicola sp. TaxID=1917219 RepID=UPI002613E306|nr:WG repeat-containing protein [Fluviicola sp.]
MKRTFFYLLLLTAACTTQPEEQETIPNSDSGETVYADVIPSSDTLYCTSNGEFEYGAPYAYVNKAGDTMIPAGEFDNCFSDIFTNFAYVSDERFKDHGMVAVNRNKEIIFEAYIFDNGPDYIYDGLFRIVRNGKIGYADPTGKVVVEAKYTCAYPFKNGKAKVALNCETVKDDLEHHSWKSDQWFYIDKTGKKVKQ